MTRHAEGGRNRRGWIRAALATIVLLVAIPSGSAPASADRPNPGPAATERAAAPLLDGRSPFKESARLAFQTSPLGRASEQVLGPYADIAGRVADALYESLLPGARTNSLYWPFLVLTAAIAAALFVFRRGRGARDSDGCERACGLREYLLPRRIYGHPSARVDIGLFLVDRALMPVWLALGIGAIAPSVERLTLQAAHAVNGPGPALTPSWGWRIAYGIAMLLVVDMVFYFTHLFGHRTRVGWAFHKVHHSAEVLTPLTRYREHFVEGALYASTHAVGLGLCGGLFAYLFRGSITEITVMNLGIFFFLFTLNANFRHYHVSLRYPARLERWLQSPGMHHAHHSRLNEHWDRNLGLVTSVWDRLFGTLHIGDRYEPTPWGLPHGDQGSYRSLMQNLLEPFREVSRLVIRVPPP